MTRASVKPQAEYAGAILAALMAHGIEAVVIGTWSIPAYLDDRPSEQDEEYSEWQEKCPPDGPLHLSLSCRISDQSMVELVLPEQGFTFSSELTGSYGRDTLVFKNRREDIIDVGFFRPAQDGGRIYPRLVRDQDWYYPPQTVSSGHLGSVMVRTECPIDLDKARAATPQDEH